MGIFRRNQDDAGSTGDVAEPAAIAVFWQWWDAEGAMAVAASVGDGALDGCADALTARVHAIDDRLAWELGPGSMALNRLVVTSGGEPQARAVARRWLLGAPSPDSSWEYADARPRGDIERVVLEVGTTRVGLDDAVVLAQRVGHHLDVALHHPVFPDLADDVRRQVTVLALISALGESDAETWLGQIAAAATAPLDAFPLVHLPSVVDELAREHLTKDGEPTWVLLQGEGPSGPVVAATQVPLRVSTAPAFDRHVLVQLPFTDRTDAGWPGDRSRAALQDLEQQLEQRLAASGRLVAHESAGGVRLWHVYVDSTGPGVEIVRTTVAAWRDGDPVVQEHYDPTWQGIAHLVT